MYWTNYKNTVLQRLNSIGVYGIHIDIIQQAYVNNIPLLETLHIILTKCIGREIKNIRETEEYQQAFNE